MTSFMLGLLIGFVIGYPIGLFIDKIDKDMKNDAR
jgi:NhaP-type Na+/H+ or K+/H+ antiporter